MREVSLLAQLLLFWLPRRNVAFSFKTILLCWIFLCIAL